MKSHTDLSQSKKLAEILPIESADMCFNTHNNMSPLMTPYSRFKEFYNMEPTPAFLIPCWSLTALLNVMPSEVVDNHFLTLNKEGKEYCCCYENYNGHSIKGCFSDNPIDACVAMIEKLNELKIL